MLTVLYLNSIYTNIKLYTNRRGQGTTETDGEYTHNTFKVNGRDSPKLTIFVD